MVGARAAAVLSSLVMAVQTIQTAAAGPALLYDTADGQVLYAEDADQPWYAASLTKMMTAYVVFKAWKSGKSKPSDIITVSANANSRPKMRLNLGAGKEISYADAVNALIMRSANDIAVAIAEAHSGTEDAFVAEMNETGKRIGMSSTRFINANGLPGEGQYTSAKDMAILAQALIRDFPEHMGIFSMTMAEVGLKKKKLIATHNTVLVTLQGGDGMKTGFTCSAGYNIVASATRDGRRLVAVVLGEQSAAKRTARASMLLEYGFKTAAWKSQFGGPTIWSLPETPFDRQAIRTANLDKRLSDCKDPEPAPDPNSPVIAGKDGAKDGAPESATAPAGAATGTETTPVKTAAVTTAGAPTAKPAEKITGAAAPSTTPVKRVVKINARKKTVKRPAAAPATSPAFSLAGQ
jgi:D-alanyl-D-alanine carboxypeptidase